MKKEKIRKKNSGKNLLKKVPLLSGLTDEEFERIWNISTKVEFSSGKVLMNEGDIGDFMYFFVEGEVKVSKNLTMKLGHKGFGHAEKSMVKLKSEHVSFFGDMAMFQNEPRSATITASEDCVVYEIKREDFKNICNENPRLGVKVLRRIADTLCDRVRKGNEDVLKLTTALSIALSK